MNVPLLIVVCLVLVWGAVFLLRAPLMLACLVMLVSAACYNADVHSFEVGSFSVSFERLAFALLLATYVVQNGLGMYPPRPLRGGDVLLLVLMGWFALRLLTAGSIPGPPPRVSPQYRLIACYLVPTVIYWIARRAATDARGVRLMFATFVVLGVYLGVTGIFEVTGQWAFVYPKVIADPEAGLHFGRARGPLLMAVSYGLFVSVCALAALVWRPQRLPRAAVWAMVPLMMAGAYLSYTRSVWLGLATGTLVVLTLLLHKRYRPAFVGAAVVAGLVVLAVKWDSIVGLERDLGPSETRESVSMRSSFAYVSWQMFLDRPLVGFGFGRFPDAKLPYLDDRSVDLQLQQIRDLVHHNNYLSVLTETGLIGFALYLAVLVSWVMNAIRLWRSNAPDWARSVGLLLLGTLGVYFWQLMFHELSYSPQDNGLVFFLAGLTAGLVPARPQRFAGTASHRREVQADSALAAAAG